LSGRNLLEDMTDQNFYGDIVPIIPPQLGWLQGKLSDKSIEKLWDCVEKYKGINTFDNQVLSNISSHWSLCDDNNWLFNTILLPLCQKYASCFVNLGENYGVTQRHNYCLSSFWVNFQKQNEFNPLHIHSAAIYSFVIWLKIPYDYREQHKIPISDNSSDSSASDFQFFYTNLLGGHNDYNYCLDKTSEGTILFFPSKLPHQVYPFFNCDEYRVSISGNITLDTSKVSIN